MVSTDLFQAFRWAENGASGEQRENNKRAGIEKKSNMSIIAQCCPYFHCQRIRPTQLVDPQLIIQLTRKWFPLFEWLIDVKYPQKGITIIPTR